MDGVKEVNLRFFKRIDKKYNNREIPTSFILATCNVKKLSKSRL